MYEKLSKVYYKDPVNYEQEYEKRFYGYGTVKLPLRIKPLKSNEDFICFYVNHNKLDLAHESILRNSFEIRERVSELPRVAIHQYVYAKLVDELVSTNEIEGIQSTRAEMTEALEARKTAVPKKVKFSNFVNSYYNLTQNTSGKIKTIEDIRNIYDELVKDEIEHTNRLDGDIFRKEGVEVVTASQRVLHKGVLPEEAIKRNLQDLFFYLNEHETPILYKIAVAHYYFGYIHPFYDGNGRTSRYISSIYLKEILDPLTALTLSFATNKSKQDYYNAFNDTNNPLNKGDLTLFCSTFFEIIEQAQETILTELLENKRKLTSLEDVIERERKNLKDEEVNVLYVIGQDYIYGLDDKGLTKNDLKEMFDMTEYKTTKILKSLLECDDIKRLSKNPVSVTLSDSLARKI